MTGGMVSRATVTLNVHVTDSRQEFVARQVTGVVPRMNTAPDGGVQVTMAFVGQLPVVVGGGYVTTAVLATPQSQLVRFGGQVMRSGLVIWAAAEDASATRSGKSTCSLFITSQWSWNCDCPRLCATRPD
jgi:hypothetical protein